MTVVSALTSCVPPASPPAAQHFPRTWAPAPGRQGRVTVSLGTGLRQPLCGLLSGPSLRPGSGASHSHPPSRSDSGDDDDHANSSRHTHRHDRGQAVGVDGHLRPRGTRSCPSLTPTLGTPDSPPQLLCSPLEPGSRGLRGNWRESVDVLCVGGQGSPPSCATPPGPDLVARQIGRDGLGVWASAQPLRQDVSVATKAQLASLHA